MDKAKVSEADVGVKDLVVVLKDQYYAKTKEKNTVTVKVEIRYTPPDPAKKEAEPEATALDIAPE